MANKTSGDGTEKPSARPNKPSGGPIVGMIARHPIFFIVPLLMFIAGLFILYLGSIDCKDGWSKCLTSTDKSSVAAGIGFIAASIALSSWLASFYREFDRQTFDLFNSLHKEFRTTKEFDSTFKAIIKIEETMSKGQAVLEGNDPFARVDAEEAVGFAAFFEIVAISVQSDLMSAEIANYFFGNYLIMALKSNKFRSKIDYDDDTFKMYWSLLHRFEERVLVEQQMKGDRYASFLRI